MSYELSDSASADDPDSLTPVDSSGLSCTSSPAGPAVRRPSLVPGPTPTTVTGQRKTTAPTLYYCSVKGCKKKTPYKSKAWFDNHMTAHKIAGKYPEFNAYKIFM